MRKFRDGARSATLLRLPISPEIAQALEATPDETIDSIGQSFRAPGVDVVVLRDREDLIVVAVTACAETGATWAQA